MLVPTAPFSIPPLRD